MVVYRVRPRSLQALPCQCDSLTWWLVPCHRQWLEHVRFHVPRRVKLAWFAALAAVLGAILVLYLVDFWLTQFDWLDGRLGFRILPVCCCGVLGVAHLRVCMMSQRPIDVQKADLKA